MLHFVQQFRRVGLQTREHRPKCCTFYGIGPRIWWIAPPLLYNIQHLPALPENLAITHGPKLQVPQVPAEDEVAARHRRRTTYAAVQQAQAYGLDAAERRTYRDSRPCFGDARKLTKNTRPVANAMEPEMDVSTHTAIA